MKCKICLLVLLFTVITLHARKDYKPLRTYIKNGGAIAQLLPTIQSLESDDELKEIGRAHV